MAILPRTFWAALGFAGLMAASPADSPPDTTQQNQILQRIGDYAGQYVERLPNFVCEQVISQFQAGRRGKHWRKGDTLSSKLMYNEGREERTLELVNNRPVQSKMRFWRTPLVTEGEFGMLLEDIFRASSHARFQWDHWDSVQGKQLAVFNFFIDKQHSTLRLSLSDLAKAIVPYHGSIYADSDSGEIWQVTNTVSEIPGALQTKSLTTTIKYGKIDIGGKTYLLPVHATVMVVTNVERDRNEIDFTGYRKFEAESTITYTPGPDSPPKP
ncbi:MAG TPA: hypothetical protein VFB14_21305 [Bryobacteraceae bacterium]|jgi:hypothetical protein|nr:hypothetical protein [Bryobacteraceae bacterium]